MVEVSFKEMNKTEPLLKHRYMNKVMSKLETEVISRNSWPGFWLLGQRHPV